MTARMSLRRSRSGPKSGRIRSTPRCSSRGNASPASTITSPPSASKTVMFFPTSPRPPSGVIRVQPIRPPSLDARVLEDAGALQARADPSLLVVARLDERKPQAAEVPAGHVQRRLDLDRPDE